MVRINYRNGAIGPVERNRKAVVTVIDMNSFSVISRRTTSDPLIADSEWATDAHNELIVTGLAEQFTEIGPSSRTVRDHYLAASLSLPSLLAQIRCEYDSVIKIESNGPGWNKPKIENTSKGCAALVERATVGSVEGLPGAPKAKDLQFAKGCGLLNVDEKRQPAVVECREGTGYADGEIFFTSSHEVKVVSTANRRAALSIPLSHSWKGINGILANTSNGDYLILIKEGIHVEVYRLAA